jgi:outer membrane biosynthesis protein TonB
MKKIFVKALIVAITATGMYSCNTQAKRSDTAVADTQASTNVQTTSQPAGDASAQTSAAEAPVLTFEETSWDFGTIQEGDVVNHTYTFTNTGKSPLIIQNATAQCGCTVPQWPRQPIAPGQKGEIKVEFNSKGKAGVQSKSVTITANTQPEVNQVMLKGVVESGVASMKGPMKK